MANDQELKGLTKQDLVDIVAAAVSAANKLNPIEQRKLDEELASQKRKNLAAVEMGRIEEESMRRRRDGCSHSRYSMAQGKLGGHAAPKGQGEWTTGGQLHGNGTATLICTRCSWTWTFEPTRQERDFIEQQGMLGMAPPPESRLIKDNVAVA
jgi:hypothetical protein